MSCSCIQRRIFYNSLMKKFVFLAALFVGIYSVEATLAGGRPNTFSQGNNAFAGVVNPANAVWIVNRFDIGVFWNYQKSTLNNKENTPGVPPGKTDLTYRSKNLYTADFAIHRHFPLSHNCHDYDFTISLASYTVPGVTKLKTKRNFPAQGTTPLEIQNKTDVLTAVFSLKLSDAYSVGLSVDYFNLSHLRNGFQNADNPLRSVSPGHVTNKGMDHSNGFGLTAGIRWNISKQLLFGAAWARKNYCGRFWKYRGFEPFHGKNYTPQTVGAGFTYRFNERWAGRLECLWSNQGNLPNANNSILPNGAINTNKRGSSKSPGPGLQDATFLNLGLGCRVNKHLSIGSGLSHRFKPRFSSNFLSHSYRRQVIYNLISLGANFNYHKHDLFFVMTKGFNNHVSGRLPTSLGGRKFSSDRETFSMTLSYGYLY